MAGHSRQEPIVIPAVQPAPVPVQTPVADGAMKRVRCPSCAQLIRIEAKVCRFCHPAVPPVLQIEAQKVATLPVRRRMLRFELNPWCISASTSCRCRVVMTGRYGRSQTD